MDQEAAGADRTAPILDIVDLKGDDSAWAEFFRKEIGREEIERILEECYGVLLRHPDFRRLMRDLDLERLKRIHTHQILTLGRELGTAGYFNERLNIGDEFARIRFPLSLLPPLYVAIQKHLVESAASRLPEKPDMASFADYLMKIFALDIYLVVEAYRRHDAEEMTKSLDDLREEAARLHRKAHTDELTGLCNYSRLMDHLDNQIETARRRRKPLCVMMSDLDHFKRVNDTYGHLAGDEVLRHVAGRIQAAVRDFDVVGRFGGEEFAVILVNTDRKLAEIIAERIRQEVAATPIHTRSGNIPLTISIGLAMLRPGDDRDSVVERADRAMYEAKRLGRNRVRVAPEEGTVH